MREMVFPVLWLILGGWLIVSSRWASDFQLRIYRDYLGSKYEDAEGVHPGVRARMAQAWTLWGLRLFGAVWMLAGVGGVVATLLGK